MKWAITIGTLLVVVVAGSLLIQNVWNDEQTQPFTPPVVELMEEQQEKQAREHDVAHGEAYDEEILDVLLQAEKNADAHALKVLQTGREMTLKEREVVQGGCWDYVNAVYNRAGCTEEKREIVFQKGKSEEYADQDMIRPGDWLFYINHGYKEVRHSAVFVDWLDYEQQTGLMLSYGGEGRGEPARYRSYDLSHVYHIIRPLEQ